MVIVIRVCATMAADSAFSAVSAFATASPAYAPARPPSPEASCPSRCRLVLALEIIINDLSLCLAMLTVPI